MRQSRYLNFLIISNPMSMGACTLESYNSGNPLPDEFVECRPDDIAGMPANQSVPSSLPIRTAGGPQGYRGNNWNDLLESSVPDTLVNPGAASSPGNYWSGADADGTPAAGDQCQDGSSNPWNLSAPAQVTAARSDMSNNQWIGFQFVEYNLIPVRIPVFIDRFQC